MWNEYQELNPKLLKIYETWAFGNSKEMADELADLVLAGIKTATASNYSMYKDEDSVPFIGLLNIVLDGDGEAVAIIEITSVEIIPFDEITEEHAFLEGDRDRTLEYWRKVNEEFF